MKEKTKSSVYKYLLLLISVVIIWGISPNVSKYLLGHYSPAGKSAFTSAVAFFAMLVLSLGKLKKLNLSYFKVAIPTGVFYSAACIMQQIGLSSTTPTMYAFLENMSCLVVPLLVWAMTKKRPTLFKLLSAVLCLLSVFILGGARLDISFGIGNILCGLAGLFYGVNIAVTGVKAKKLDPMLYLLIQFGVNFVISTTYAHIFEDIKFTVDAGLISLMVGITLVSTVIGWFLRTICLKHLDPTLVAVIMPFSSVVTTVISIAIGEDKLTPYLVIGVIVGLAAALISDVVIKKKDKSTEESAPLEKVE